VINQMQAIMAAHMDAPLPLPRIAAELDLNPRQLRHRCQQATGTTPTQVYTTLRLTRARKLTQDTALSVAEIAKATGFTSPSSFTRAYRDHFGQAPRFERAEKTAKHAARTKHAVKTKKAPDKAPQSEQVMSWSEAEDAARPTAPAPSEDRNIRAT
jgi:AraC family carnitine catabolism transcriptional activator